MPQRSAIDELNEYIERDEIEESSENISQSVRRHELFGRVRLPLPNSTNLNDFMGRLRQIELFRRRQHRKLRSTLSRDYDGNLIDLFDQAGHGDEEPPPPPPPSLFSVAQIAAIVAGSEALHYDQMSSSQSQRLQSGADSRTSIISASLDESFLPSRSTVTSTICSPKACLSPTKSVNRDLMTALSRRRRLKHEQDLSYLLGLDIENDDTQDCEGIR